MLEAGMPVLKSLSTVAESFQGPVGKSFSALAKEVSAGNGLAETMKKQKNVFAPLDVMLVEAADISGKLPQTFKMLSQWYDFTNWLKGIVVSGLMLPLVLICAYSNLVQAVMYPHNRYMAPVVGTIVTILAAYSILHLVPLVRSRLI